MKKLFPVLSSLFLPSIKLITLYFFAFLLFAFEFASAQNIGIGTNTPHSSAALDVTSTNTGFLPPRMTLAQRNAIPNPAQGLIVYCTDCGSNGGEPQYFNGTAWYNINGNAASTNFVNLSSVTIGTQIWSSKNLDVRTYRNGDPIPQVTDPTAWANLTSGGWCWYNNDSATYGSVYGRLYNWYAVNDPRGLAPQGWHVASDAEWNTLAKFIDPSADTTCNSCRQSSIAGGVIRNVNGFFALPGGYRWIDGWFNAGGYYSCWWPGNEFDINSACNRSVDWRNSGDLGRGPNDKRHGFYVRVIRD
jgi:uncharacterized protein (TIGR02145 family)